MITKDHWPLCCITAKTNSVAEVVCNMSGGVAPYKIYPLYISCIRDMMTKDHWPLCCITAKTHSVAAVVCDMSGSVAPYKIYPLYTSCMRITTQMMLLHNQAVLKNAQARRQNISSGSLRSHDVGGCRATPDGESTKHSDEAPGSS